MEKPKKVVIGCQGGGMHAAFGVGVLIEVLKRIDEQKKRKANDEKRFELVGLSGTSAGALCALLTWYGLAPKKHSPGSEHEAIDKLRKFWDGFVAIGGMETALNFLTYRTFWAEELEVPLLGVNAPVLSSLNPYGAIFKMVAALLPHLGVREQYFDLEKLLAEACPALRDNSVDWHKLETRLLIGATQVVDGLETVFDSDVNKEPHRKEIHPWRQRLPLTLSGVAASGTLPIFRKAQRVENDYYWDGLYSQNPPIREFIAGVCEVPDELWLIRINPQQWRELPKSNADIQDRQNELMGNLSLHKELDFLLKVNAWIDKYKNDEFSKDHKKVTVRTIKMKERTADELRYSSKFNRNREFMEKLRREGEDEARDWLDRWHNHKASEYPEDAGYRKI
jgi:NTE family protein